jgi:hypothetical protein
MLAHAVPTRKAQSKQARYKAASDAVLIFRADEKKEPVSVEFKNGSSKEFIFALANK